MCRLMAYVGQPVLVADVVLWPDRSIIKQSYDARERIMDASLPSHLAHGNLNGDGFGIGWHNACSEPSDPTPCVFTSVTPAWNNDNLGRLASKIISPLVFAHVRAAMPGMPVSEQNCHPFQWNRYMWMHNGVVGGFMKIRRALLAQLSDAAYDTIQSFHSDSAICFSIFLHYLPDLTSRHQPYTILKALEAMLALIAETQQRAGITETSLLNFVVTDGHTMIATRCVFPETEPAASLYYAEGSAFQRSSRPVNDVSPVGTTKLGGNASLDSRASARDSSVTGESAYCMEASIAGGTRVVLVASEPITRSSGDWVAVPKNTALVISREKHGCIDIVRTPLHASGCHARQEEIKMCLDAVTSATDVSAQLYRTAEKRPRLSEARFVHFKSPYLCLFCPENWLCKRTGGPQARPDQLIRDNSFVLPEQLCAFVRTSDRQEHSLTGHAGAVLCFTILDDHLLFSGSVDHTIKVWDLDSCTCMHTLRGHNKPIQKLEISGGLLYSTAGRKLRIWDLSTFRCISNVHTQDDGGALRALAVAENRTIYVAGQDAIVRAFRKPEELAEAPLGDPAEEVQLPTATTQEADGHCSVIHALAICNGHICSGGGDAMIRVWKAESLDFVGVLRGHRGSVLTLFALHGLLLSGGRDNIIRIWDMDALVCRRTLTGHRNDVLCITGVDLLSRIPAVSSAIGMGLSNGRENGSSLTLEELGNGQSLDSLAVFASASADATVRIWSAAAWSCLRILLPGGGSPTSSLPFLSVYMSSRYTVTGSAAGVIGLWPVEDILPDALQRMSRACSSESTDLDTIAELEGTSCPAKRRREAGGKPGSCMERELEQKLREFVTFKTVSSDRSLREDCYKGAKYLSRLLVEVLGAEVKMIRPRDDKNPVVIGRLGRAERRPTITFYGHYDVQPAMEREWATDPFQVHSEDGYFYGRGTSDNKGPILGFIYAVKELLEEGKASKGSLPVNVAFVFEGEEENGSVGFEDAIKGNLHWFEGTQLVVISNTLWVGERVPCLTYGMRGMIALSVEIKGPARDLHSGNEGGVFNEPTSDLTKLLAKLVDSGNHILIPGWYDAVRHNTLAPALERLDALSPPEFTLVNYRNTLGIPELRNKDTHELLRARWCEPTLSIVDVRVGDDEENSHDPFYRFGPTRFSVIPRLAVGNISVRFVPDQRPEDLVAKLRAHVEAEFAALGSGNSVSMRVKSVGDWWEADPQSKLFRLAERALFQEWGVLPLYVREGGTMPVASTLEKLLGAPALLVPFGQASDNCHLANERLQRVNLLRSKNVIKNLLLELELATS